MVIKDKGKDARRSAQKALRIIKKMEEYSSVLGKPSAIGEGGRALLAMWVQSLHENIKEIKRPLRWQGELRALRNRIAHQKGSDDALFEKTCSFLSGNMPAMRGDLERIVQANPSTSKEKRGFEVFASSALGSKDERMQLVDAMEDMMASVEPMEEKIEFPGNKFASSARDMLEKVLAKDGVRPYMLTHPGLSENIQTDILEWIQKAGDTLEKENPFLDEAAFIGRCRKTPAEELALDLSGEKPKVQYHYRRLPSVSKSRRESIAESTLDFDFYGKAFAAQKQTRTEKDGKETLSWKSAEELETLRRNFIADMERNLLDRKNRWEQERIDALRREFLEELYKKIKNFMRLEKLLLPFISDLGRLWDLSGRPFETSGFELLGQFARLLEQDESLQELARLLGRQSRAQESLEKELRDKVVVRTEWHPRPAYRGEICGLRWSADISAALPAELALSKNPMAKKLFQLKFAQKQLLSFDYQDNLAESKAETEKEEVDVAIKEPKGPVVICVDTSGSMHGAPENIAKTVTFALAKIAVEEERGCYVISFSTGIETLDMSNFAAGDALPRCNL